MASPTRSPWIVANGWRFTRHPGKKYHLINYGGREIEGLRLRLRGTYNGEARIAGAGRLPLQDHIIASGFTESSIPRIATYAAIDLEWRGETSAALLVSPQIMRTLTLTIALSVVIVVPALDSDHPKIVFIMSDDHAAHAIGAYGSRVNQTPQP